jgi:hypothetical protein
VHVSRIYYVTYRHLSLQGNTFIFSVVRLTVTSYLHNMVSLLRSYLANNPLLTIVFISHCEITISCTYYEPFHVTYFVHSNTNKSLRITFRVLHKTGV